MSTPIKTHCAVAGCGAEVEYTPGGVVAALSVDKTVARVGTGTLRVALTCNNPTTPHTVFYEVDPLKGQITASQQGGAVVATVTDQYWLNFAETIVKAAYERRDQAADKIQAYVTWLWTLFTGATAVGYGFQKLSVDMTSITLIVIAQILLLCSYWLTVVVRIPRKELFDSRQATAIQRAHEDGLHHKCSGWVGPSLCQLPAPPALRWRCRGPLTMPSLPARRPRMKPRLRHRRPSRSQ